MKTLTTVASCWMALMMIPFAVESAKPEQVPGALDDGVEAAVKGESSIEQRYIVVLEDPPIALYEGGLSGLAPTSARAVGVRRLDTQSEAARAYNRHLRAGQDQVLGAMAQRLGRMPAAVFRYTVATNGFAVDLTAEEASQAMSVAGVRLVERERTLQPQTDQGPAWINADEVWNNVDPSLQTRGEGMLIGIVDSGLNLDHPSFAAVGGDGYVHNNPLGSGVFLGSCAADPGTYVCNDKLVGYWVYTGEVGDDSDGHGRLPR